MITRDEALYYLNKLADNDILGEEINEAIDDIRYCIEKELDGLHAWGCDNDFFELYVAVREDLQTDDWMDHCQMIHDKYAFGPSFFEEPEIKAHMEEWDDAED